ncbi:hypothetical protein HN935_01775 [archaeon]|jgi:hypothetical protein|nr:hypothetical protein [archaeon]
MLNKFDYTLITILGILMILPLVGVTQLGNLVEGITAWVLAVFVIIIGVYGFIKAKQ